MGRTLDPPSPDFKCEEGGPVVWSDGVEDSNAIDPGVLRAPDGRLWLTYGSYFGYIRLVELDPSTGQRREPDRAPLNVAINSEASILIQRDGWYYPLVTHGSCCRGANSTYNIRMGRSRKVTGPYLDNMGVDMIEGGGKLFAASRGRHVGPGHFGLLDLGDGVAEILAALRGGPRSRRHERARPPARCSGAMAGRSRATTWWRAPTPLSPLRTGTVLELAVQGSPVGGFRQRRGGPPGSGIVGGGPRRAGLRPALPPGGPPGGPPPAPQVGAPVADQEPAQVASSWPAIADLRLAPAMLQAQQKWVIAPVANVGGYPGSSWFRISVAGTERSLTAIEGGELQATPFTGAPEQLWRIDQMADGASGSTRSRCPARPIRCTSPPWAAACPRCRSSIRPAIANAGIWERPDEIPARHSFAVPRYRRRGTRARQRAARSHHTDEAEGAARAVDPRGFIQRWFVLEPVPVQGRLTEPAVRESLRQAALPEVPGLPMARRSS